MKKHVYFTFALLIVGFGVSMMLRAQSTPRIIKDSLVFELGTQVQIETEDLIKTNNTEVLESVRIDTSEITLGEGHSFLGVGIYHVPITYVYNEIIHEQIVLVEVVDTTKPSFVEYETQLEVVVGRNYRTDFFEHFFSVMDYSNVNLQFELDNVDFSTIGTYKARVQATDDSGNKESIKFEVVVSEGRITQEEADALQCSGTPYSVTAPTSVDGIIVVNKRHPLPYNYAPGENQEAVQMLQKMIADMQALGLDISSTYSGFRSYEYQAQLYNKYVNAYGKEEADRFSARPGFSEHQTGLGFDLRHQNKTLVEKETEAQWIAQNAHHYGFIVRYLDGTESITGYTYEPWHLRYVGDLASEIYESTLTLEEFLGVHGGSYCD